MVAVIKMKRGQSFQFPDSLSPLILWPTDRSVGDLCAKILAVEASDIGDGDVFGTLGLTRTCVGAVTESELVHLGNHSTRATLALYLTLRQKSELADFSCYKKHSGAILTSSRTCTATDTGSRIHSHVGYFLGDGQRVGILGTAT